MNKLGKIMLEEERTGEWGDKWLAEPLLPRDFNECRHLSLEELRRENPIEAALIDMYLPPAIKRDIVQLARQNVSNWRSRHGEMRTVKPAVVLWGLLAQDTAGRWFRGSLIGVEGGAQIEAVMEGTKVLELVSWAAGGGDVALDNIGFILWSNAAAPLEDGVFLYMTLDLSDPDLPDEIADWLRACIAKDPDFDTTNLHLGKRALPHVTSVSLYRVQPYEGDFAMKQVGPLLRTVSQGYSAFFLGSRKYPWRGQHGERPGFVSDYVRRLRLLRALENPIANPSYQLPSLTGDSDAVNGAAGADYARRHRSDIWRPFLPPPNEPPAIADARTFVQFVNSNLLDLHIPVVCAEPDLDLAAPRDLPYTARIRDLPFWDCYELVEITERLGGRRRRTSLLWAKDPDRLPTSESSLREHPESAGELAEQSHALKAIVGLDGTSYFINLINKLHSLVGRLKIDASTARTYIEFFCANVHADAGSFSILEHPDDVDWTGFHHAQKEKLGPCLFPMRLWPGYDQSSEGHEKVEPGDFIIEASLTYGGGLYRSIFLTKPSGIMDMLSDNMLIADLDVRAYSWTQKNNWLLATFPEVK